MNIFKEMFKSNDFGPKNAPFTHFGQNKYFPQKIAQRFLVFIKP